MLVEFAFVAPFVILLLVGTVEVTVTLFINSTLQGAAEDAAREIRTGQVQESADPVTTFQNKFCDSVFHMIDCSEVTFDVRSFSSFANVDTSLQFDENGHPINPQFSPGNSGQITLVRVMYRWHYFTPLIAQALSTDGTGSTLLMATMAFQNEPYDLHG